MVMQEERMSHFTLIKTKFADQDILVEALGDLGFKKLEIYQQPAHLYGYQGDMRQQTAEIIIRREQIGPASNDIGFKRGADGCYQALISEYDQSKYNEAWLNQLTAKYAYHGVKKKLKAQGFKSVSEEKSPDGRIHIKLRRMA
jgi:hypothetical protein